MTTIIVSSVHPLISSQLHLLSHRMEKTDLNINLFFDGPSESNTRTIIARIHVPGIPLRVARVMTIRLISSVAPTTFWNLSFACWPALRFVLLLWCSLKPSLSPAAVTSTYVPTVGRAGAVGPPAALV